MHPRRWNWNGHCCRYESASAIATTTIATTNADASRGAARGGPCLFFLTFCAFFLLDATELNFRLYLITPQHLTKPTGQWEALQSYPIISQVGVGQRLPSLVSTVFWLFRQLANCSRPAHGSLLLKISVTAAHPACFRTLTNSLGYPCIRSFAVHLLLEMVWRSSAHPWLLLGASLHAERRGEEGYSFSFPQPPRRRAVRSD